MRFQLKFKDKEYQYVLCTSPNAKKIGRLMKKERKKTTFELSPLFAYVHRQM